MRHLIVVLALLILTAPSILAADEKPWPQKGDTIFIAAKLEGFNNPMVMVGGYGAKMPDVPTLDACAPTTLRSRSDEADRFTVRDDMHNDRKLIGEWLPRLHKTAKECQAQIQSSGLPRVQMVGGSKYTLVSEPAKE